MPGTGLSAGIRQGKKCLQRSYLFFYHIEDIFLPEYLENVEGKKIKNVYNHEILEKRDPQTHFRVISQ